MNGVQDFSVRAAELWRDIVNFALDTPEDRLEQLATTLAGAWTESKASLLRKLKAVRTAAASGLDRQGICKLGQPEEPRKDARRLLPRAGEPSRSVCERGRLAGRRRGPSLKTCPCL